MATAVAATTIATVAAAMMTEGHHFAVTAHEGDSNDREEHRQTKNNNTVHPQILQLLTGTVSETPKLPSRRRSRDSRRLSVALRPTCASHCILPPEAVPVVKIYGLRRM